MTRRTQRWIRAIIVVAAGAVALPSGIRAGSHETCTLEGQNFMAFGSYDPMSNNPLDLQGRVSYRCRSDRHNADAINVQISLSAGNAGGFNRYMAGSRDRLHYNLYLDPQRQTVWGDGTGGTRVYTDQAELNNRVVSVPVYGRILGAQDVRAGGYFDDVIVTLDF